jgi:hypothetical protein
MTYQPKDYQEPYYAGGVFAGPLREYGAKWTLATLRKCVYPFPVYETHFAVPRTDVDCEIRRMSFWAPLDKPLASNLGSRRERAAKRGFLVKAVVEDKRDGSRFEDTGQAPAAKRVMAKNVLRELLAYLDGEHNRAEVVDQARAIAA